MTLQPEQERTFKRVGIEAEKRGHTLGLWQTGTDGKSRNSCDSCGEGVIVYYNGLLDTWQTLGANILEEICNIDVEETNAMIIPHPTRMVEQYAIALEAFNTDASEETAIACMEGCEAVARYYTSKAASSAKNLATLWVKHAAYWHGLASELATESDQRYYITCVNAFRQAPTAITAEQARGAADRILLQLSSKLPSNSEDSSNWQRAEHMWKCMRSTLVDYERNHPIFEAPDGSRHPMPASVATGLGDSQSWHGQEVPNA